MNVEAIVRPDALEVVETTTTTKPGILVRTWSAITKNKLVLGVATTAAAAGAGYYAYMLVRDGANEEDIARAATNAASAAKRIFG